jgi:predicted lipoprotein with Yx(FWY)xxD motif
MSSIHRPVALGATAVAAALLAAACSSGIGTHPAAANGSSAATVGVRSGPLGKYLVDGSGRALYLFLSDGTNKSSCKGTCLVYWPLLTSSGKPAAADGVTGGRLATFAGAGGANVVSYAGHPLYYFALDKAPGDTKGQGRDDFGAKWWLVAPSGTPITGGSVATPSSSAPAGGGSNGYSGGGYG